MHRMVKRAVGMEGTVTGEHGVGLIKRDYLEHEMGETTVDAMRKVSISFSQDHLYEACRLGLMLTHPFLPSSSKHSIHFACSTATKWCGSTYQDLGR